MARDPLVLVAMLCVLGLAGARSASGQTQADGALRPLASRMTGTYVLKNGNLITFSPDGRLGINVATGKPGYEGATWEIQHNDQLMVHWIKPAPHTMVERVVKLTSSTLFLEKDGQTTGLPRIKPLVYVPPTPEQLAARFALLPPFVSSPLAQHLVGTWQGGRHSRTYLADGRFGLDATAADQCVGRWRLTGNQLTEYWVEGSLDTTVESVTADTMTDFSNGQKFESKRTTDLPPSTVH